MGQDEDEEGDDKRRRAEIFEMHGSENFWRNLEE